MALQTIAIVVSQFNPNITEKLLQGTLSTLVESGICRESIKVVEVPGAIEIPLVAKLLAHSKKYQAIICLGAVIRGETLHFDYVCQQVSLGCQLVSLESTIPVIFGVLTTKNLKQAEERVSEKAHKGVEVANAAISMINLTQTIKQS